MGSIKIQKLTDDEIVARYVAGESQGLLSLKARISTSRIREILVRNGVRVRSTPEAQRLELRTRQASAQAKLGRWIRARA